ncbi:hypothetical protein [Staphylococcus virus vB_SurM-PSU5]|nr:hypothetical protein [Staphylococcus virus vB_SurM-PSU5]
MNKELMEFLNKHTNYNFGYVKTNLYVNQEGKLESLYKHIGENNDDIIHYGMRQKTLLYGVEKTKNDYVTSTITILEKGNNYDLLELGILKLENATEEEVKRHLVYKNYDNERSSISEPLEGLPVYEALLKEK